MNGADYAYLLIPRTEMDVCSNSYENGRLRRCFVIGIDLRRYEDDMADYDSIDNMEEGYKTKWKKFITENDDAKVRFEKVRDNAYRMLKHEPGNQVNDYVDALARQIKLKPSDADEYIEYDRTDWKADFDDYISDKMDF